MRYVSSLISGVGIFCFGTGLSLYHGFHGLLYPEPMESFFYAYLALGGSFLTEGGTLIIAIKSLMKGAKEKKMSFSE